MAFLIRVTSWEVDAANGYLMASITALHEDQGVETILPGTQRNLKVGLSSVANLLESGLDNAGKIAAINTNIIQRAQADPDFSLESLQAIYDNVQDQATVESGLGGLIGATHDVVLS